MLYYYSVIFTCTCISNIDQWQILVFLCGKFGTKIEKFSLEPHSFLSYLYNYFFFYRCILLYMAVVLVVICRHLVLLVITSVLVTPENTCVIPSIFRTTSNGKCLMNEQRLIGWNGLRPSKAFLLSSSKLFISSFVQSLKLIP